jgi:hypothetical protein
MVAPLSELSKAQVEEQTFAFMKSDFTKTGSGQG